MQTRATRALDSAGVAYDVHPYQHDPAAASFGLEAAELLGIEPSLVFKTLVACFDDDARQLGVAVVPVSDRLSLKKLAQAAGAKRATMASIPDAERATGYVAGGISPFGQRRKLPIWVDESASICDRVWVSGGQRGLDLSLAPADLVEVTGASYVALCE